MPNAATNPAPVAAQTYRGIKYCLACGNPDCVNVAEANRAKPFWSRCPATPAFGMPSS